MKYFRNGAQFCPVTPVLAKNITVKEAKPIKKNGSSRYILQGRLHVRSFFCLFFFEMPIKTLGSQEKNRVCRETGNTHIFFGLIIQVPHVRSTQ